VTRIFGYGGRKRLPYLLLIIVILPAIGLVFHLQVVEVGDRGFSFRVNEGDIIAHQFTHSMYDVPVVERLRVKQGVLNLFHFTSPSDAALEYYMVEGRQEGNVNRDISEFRIPAGSNGGHVLKINDRLVPAGVLQAEKTCIRIRLARLPVIVYCVRSLRKQMMGADDGSR